MKEVPITFGPDGHLVGTLTLPGEGSPRPVVLLLCNAGVIARMGPHRINVKVARQAAAEGFAVLRFDLSGQGDSRAAPSAVPFDEQASLDIRAAMDQAQRLTGVMRFALAGICSGAQHGLTAALVDPRLVGVWMMDAYTYPTRRTLWVRLGRQLREQPGRTLAGWLLRPFRAVRVALARALDDPGEGAPLLADGYGPTPSRQAFAAMMDTLVARGVSLNLVFSGGLFWRYNYAGQLRDAFRGHRFVDSVRCDYMPDVDHTVTSLRAQQHIVQSICIWLRGIRPAS